MKKMLLNDWYGYILLNVIASEIINAQPDTSDPDFVKYQIVSTWHDSFRITHMSLQWRHTSAIAS